MLGHPVPFSYCTQCSDSFPCRKIVDCWSHQVDVLGFLQSSYTPEEVERILAPPKPKVVQLIELIRKASARKD